MADQRPDADDVRPLMFAIKALDPAAHLCLSEYTGKWYIEAKVEVSDGCILSGVTEHRETPAQAVRAFVEALQAISLDEVIVAKPTGQRRHYRWNGAAFAEQYDHRLVAARNDGSGA